MHIRDFIFPFSNNLGNYWTYVQGKFGMGRGILVEAKNHVKPIKENHILVTAKYLGVEKYTSFGLIICRNIPHKSAKKSMKKIWTKEKIMLLPITDDDLMKMLELKEKNEGVVLGCSRTLDGGIEGVYWHGFPFASTQGMKPKFLHRVVDDFKASYLWIDKSQYKEFKSLFPKAKKTLSNDRYIVLSF